MASNSDTVTAALAEVDRLRSTLKKQKTTQVRSQDERSLAKATASAWFNDHRSKFQTLGAVPALATVDDLYQRVLEASDRATSRATYTTLLKNLREALILLRKDTLSSTATRVPTPDQAPDFSPLTSDTQMQEILVERWQECVKCINADASLSATVMMGGLLETLLLGRINREFNKAPVFQSKSAPKDKAGKTKPLGEWMLKDFIGTAHDLKWITVSAKEVAEVLRDFRNYIHPHKQLTHGVRLSGDDAQLLWEISKSVAVQVLRSCK